MKNIIYIIISITLLTACGNTKDQKALAIVSKYEHQLCKPYGYTGFKQLGRVSLDSAEVKLPYRKEVQGLVSQLNKVTADNQRVYAEIKKGGTSYAVYNIMADELRRTDSQAHILQAQINEMEKSYNPRIPGWMTMHRFRIIQKNGYMKLFQYIFYLDPQVTKITGYINLSDSIPIYQQL